MKPHILLFAATDIETGTELRYDYGGGDLPWRSQNLSKEVGTRKRVRMVK
jgi:hypothetical protein